MWFAPFRIQTLTLSHPAIGHIAFPRAPFPLGHQSDISLGQHRSRSKNTQKVEKNTFQTKKDRMQSSQVDFGVIMDDVQTVPLLAVLIIDCNLKISTCFVDAAMDSMKDKIRDTPTCHA